MSASTPTIGSRRSNTNNVMAELSATEDEEVHNTSAASSNFKFPFFDNTQDLDLSKSYQGDRIGQFLSPPARNKAVSENDIREDALDVKDASNSILSPSAFGAMTLSPIAVNRESGTSPLPTKRTGEDMNPNLHGEHGELGRGQVGETVASVSLPIEGSDPSLLEDDLKSAKKQVGESSSNFIDKIRNAAHKRKVAVTRSRDSLVAKEREQLRSIAESKAMKENRELVGEDSSTSQSHNKGSRVSEKRPKPSRFRNPLKSRKGVGFSGLGVPKVEKRPTTTPFSPLLGARRRKKVSVKALEAPSPLVLTREINAPSTLPPQANEKRKSKQTDASRLSAAARDRRSSLTATTGFKARPMPSSTGIQGRAGQLGVPKVPKRSTTVPVSPGLGRKRPVSKGKERNSGVAFLEPDLLRRSLGSSLSMETRSSTPSNGENSGLLGLDFLGATPESLYRERKNGKSLRTPQLPTMEPFEPHSTKRANERARYDVVRDENRQERLKEERERLKAQIRMIQKELLLLSQKL